uniref:Uncharacterized protein n=1 Tax=Opuntia streptacantha TaxID=393608 RepID=A0A7C9A5L8_OPUST
MLLVEAYLTINPLLLMLMLEELALISSVILLYLCKQFLAVAGLMKLVQPQIQCNLQDRYRVVHWISGVYCLVAQISLDCLGHLKENAVNPKRILRKQVPRLKLLPFAHQTLEVQPSILP